MAKHNSNDELDEINNDKKAKTTSVNDSSP